MGGGRAGEGGARKGMHDLYNRGRGAFDKACSDLVELIDEISIKLICEWPLSR